MVVWLSPDPGEHGKGRSVNDAGGLRLSGSFAHDPVYGIPVWSLQLSLMCMCSNRLYLVCIIPLSVCEGCVGERGQRFLSTLA